MEAHELIEGVGPALGASRLVDGLFLGGSFGKGSADAWSDVDLIAIAPVEQHEKVVAWWRDWLSERDELIYWKQWRRGATLVNAITQSWLRIDMLLPGSGSLDGRPQDAIRPLYDPRDLYSPLVPSLPPRQPDAQAVLEMVEEFIRIIGLTPVALGRREYVVMAMGNGMLRDLLSRLMQEELPLPDRGGLLHLNKLLSAADIRTLETLPYPAPERDALIEGQLAVARVFFPRAKRLAAQLNLDWPARFEASARAHLGQAIGREPHTLWAI